jgi:putative protease
MESVAMSQIVRRKAGDFIGPKPEILAPAGNRDAFLAALAAGADAVYCGLKTFSARMAAQNFSLEELAALAPLARKQGAKLYLTVNTLLKTEDLMSLGRQLDLVDRHVKPDAIIFQDLAVAELAKQVGLKGELHLSTLANVSMVGVLNRLPKTLGVQRVVLPRELTIEEVKQAAGGCPNDLGLEIFIHGALCYGVSGRCYWSSYLGGKSGLRGRCVQPCRRRYRQEKQKERFFACQDLGLDMLVKVLAGIPQIRAWKIEGRKKGPHYVYYTVTAYRMLRDEGQDPQIKKAAMQLLEQALGRPATHYHFLPQRPQNPVDTAAPSGSGLLAGAVRGGRQKPYIEPRFDLLAHDKLRIGYEDDAWHHTVDLKKAVPKKGKFFFQLFRGRKPAKGTPVFLIDRREPVLAEKIEALEQQLGPDKGPLDQASSFSLRLSPGSPKKPHVRFMHVLRKPGPRMRKTSLAIWLDLERSIQPNLDEPVHTWWWLPPVIWPDDESRWREQVALRLRDGGPSLCTQRALAIIPLSASQRVESLGRSLLQHRQSPGGSLFQDDGGAGCYRQPGAGAARSGSISRKKRAALRPRGIRVLAVLRVPHHGREFQGESCVHQPQGRRWLGSAPRWAVLGISQLAGEPSGPPGPIAAIRISPVRPPG